MKDYLKGRFELYGIKTPHRKQFFKEFWTENKNEIRDNWRDFVQWLWQQDYRDHHYFAMDIIGKIEKKLEKDDLSLMEELITTHSWWDSVDFLASHGVGQILKSDTALQMKTVERYMQTDNLWLRRTAIIFQIFYKKQTNEDLLFTVIDDNLSSEEFFIRKACGWALRQYSKTNPAAVKEYIDVRRPLMSGLTLREGSKYIN